MLNDLNAESYDIYIACGYTDLRLGIDGLANRVSSFFGISPFTRNTIFLFCGRRSDRIKGLLWEGDGFLLLYKRLESGRFRWPRTKDEVLNMTPQQYRWLMEGLEIHQSRAVREVSPKHVL